MVDRSSFSSVGSLLHARRLATAKALLLIHGQVHCMTRLPDIEAHSADQAGTSATMSVSPRCTPACVQAAVSKQRLVDQQPQQKAMLFYILQVFISCWHILQTLFVTFLKVSKKIFSRFKHFIAIILCLLQRLLDLRKIHHPCSTDQLLPVWWSGEYDSMTEVRCSRHSLRSAINWLALMWLIRRTGSHVASSSSWLQLSSRMSPSQPCHIPDRLHTTQLQATIQLPSH